ncbi:ABC transporter permease [Nioella sp.]|uniref:ABC transporter permease n=1 Tax=Nioella sp. TaxID=1912091 RepID=UPI003515F377
MQIRILSFIAFLWLPVVLITLWWVFSEQSGAFFFPPLSRTLLRMWTDLSSGELLRDTFVSLRNVAAGLCIALVLGVAFGIAIGQRRALREAVWPLLSFVRAIPGVAIVPIVIVAFGIGAGPKIFLIASTAIWPILLNTIDGVRGVKESILETARAYRLPRPVIVRDILLPAALPQVMAGTRIALSVSLTVMVISEFASGNEGMGYYILNGTERFDMTQVWAGTVWIGLIGFVVNVAFVAAERRLLGWYYGLPSRGPKASRPATIPLKKKVAAR